MFKSFTCVPGENVVEISKDDVKKYLNNGKSHVWIDITSPVDEHYDFLSSVMGIHRLAIEDLGHPRMLPKVEEYDNYIFLILHDIVLAEKESRERLKTFELYMFIGKNYVVTIRRHRIRAVETYLTELPALSHIFTRGAEAMAHAILRRMIDSYFPMLDRIEAKLDVAEEKIFNSPISSDLQQIFILRKDIVKLRSIAVAQLDVINRLALGEFAVLSDHGLLLARDLYDHLYRVSEKASGFREVIMGLLDAYLSQNSNKLNEVIKVLTIIATLILPLGIVVGFYGMNFKFLPGLGHPHGWLFTLLGMLVISLSMVAYFRHRRWL